MMLNTVPVPLTILNPPHLSYKPRPLTKLAPNRILRVTDFPASCRNLAESGLKIWYTASEILILVVLFCTTRHIFMNSCVSRLLDAGLQRVILWNGGITDAVQGFIVEGGTRYLLRSTTRSQSQLTNFPSHHTIKSISSQSIP
jgi:hypothetical protein